MSKEGFNWKSLFINDEQNASQKQEPVKESIPNTQTFPNTPPVETNKFPDATNTIATNINISSLTNPFQNEILDVYQKGFETLNQEGFDFFEMYKSVVAVGVTNPQSYQMAFTMGKSIKADLTKQILIEKSKFYIDEINKVFTKYDTTGNARKQDLNQVIQKEKESLTVSIADLEARIAQMQQELQEKKILLINIDSKNEEELKNLQLKIEANNIAKHKILESINTVVSGINQYL